MNVNKLLMKKINEIKQHKQELDAKLQQDKQIAEDKIAEIKEHKKTSRR